MVNKLWPGTLVDFECQHSPHGQLNYRKSVLFHARGRAIEKRDLETVSETLQNIFKSHMEINSEPGTMHS